MFVHARSRSLLFEADPAVIAAAVPARPVSGPGFSVAVKHSAAATLKLRELGYPAPSPIVSYYDWPKYKGRYEPFAHQKLMAEFMCAHKRCFNLSEMGCVDALTEYLSPTGWRRIDSYEGGPVAQYWPETGEIDFVEAEYVKLPCDRMIRFETTRGVDQLLSPEHRVLLADGRVVSAQHVLDTYGSQSLENRSFRFRTTFKIANTPGIPLSDAQIRLQVAANADGYFKGGKVFVRVKRPRKIERMRKLLVEAGLPVKERSVQPEGFVIFTFEPPWSKGFDARWWSATQAQLEVVADEVTHWDGSKALGNRGPRFCGSPMDVDFVQYAFGAAGLRATIKLNETGRYVKPFTNLTASTSTTVGLVQRNTAREPNVRVEPSTDGFKYCFMVPSTFLLLRRNGCIVATGNTSKTSATLWALDWMMQERQIKRALVLAPLSTLEQVWLIGTTETTMHRKAVVLHGSVEKRLKLLAQPADIYILNHDGLGIQKIREALARRADIDHIVVDEGSKFRNAKTDKYRALQRILAARPTVGLWWLTGTPCPSSPADAWAQCKLVNPAKVPAYYGQFRMSVMTEGAPHIWVPRKGHQDTVFRVMQPAIRFAKKDCLDLPPMMSVDRHCEMSSEQSAFYRQMTSAMTIESKALAEAGASITAVNAADRVNKLRQIMLGAVKTSAEDYMVLDYGPRFHVLLEAIEEATAKVIVIAPFKGIIQDLQQRLSKHYSVGMVNGDVSASQRNKIFAQFKGDKDPHVLLCHPAVMAHGLNLTEADTIIMFGPMYSNDDYRQVIERINRPPQDKKMTMVRISCNALERAIYHSLDTDEKQQQLILQLYRTIIGEHNGP